MADAPKPSPRSTVQFDWAAWWKAERFGVIWSALLCLSLPILGVIAAIGDGTAFDPFFLWYGLAAAVWCTIYCGGWHLLVMAVLKLRARFGWITYRPAKPDQ